MLLQCHHVRHGLSSSNFSLGLFQNEVTWLNCRQTSMTSWFPMATSEKAQLWPHFQPHSHLLALAWVHSHLQLYFFGSYIHNENPHGISIASLTFVNWDNASLSLEISCSSLPAYACQIGVAVPGSHRHNHEISFDIVWWCLICQAEDVYCM